MILEYGYTSPEIEVLEIVVEKGFLLSDSENESYDIESGMWD